MDNWTNPDIPEPEIESDGSDTSVTILVDGVWFSFYFSSQAEAFAFIDQYKNAYQVKRGIKR
jgi:hypothetical protein